MSRWRPAAVPASRYRQWDKGADPTPCEDLCLHFSALHSAGGWTHDWIKQKCTFASIIEQLQHLLKCWLSCIDFSTHYKNTYIFKTADVYCSEITFFHNDALPPPPPPKKRDQGKTILYKGQKWKSWKVKYEKCISKYSCKCHHKTYNQL